MTVEDFKNENRLEINLTQKDSIWLKTIYNEFKKAEKVETGKALEKLDLLKNNVRNEVVYIMEYGEWYLVESWDTISHINAMLPKWYSIKIFNPKYLLSDSNIRITVKNNKLLINGQIDSSSSIRWGENEEAKNSFDDYKASKWAKNCFMTYDNEKKVYIAEEGKLVISCNKIRTLEELKQKTIEYRERKADEKATKIAEEAGVIYNREKNIYITEKWNFTTNRDNIKNAYELKSKIVEYIELMANKQAKIWAIESGALYNEKKKQYSYNNLKLIINRDDISSLEELKQLLHDFDEKIAEKLAYNIANALKDKWIVYDSKSQLYVYNWWEFMCSRNLVSTISELEEKIDAYIKEKKASIATTKEIKEKIDVPKFIDYKVKKWDILWNIIKHNFQNLWMEDNKNKNIWNYYNENKEVIIATNNLRLDRKWNPIIIIGQNIKLPTLQIENKETSTEDSQKNLPTSKEVEQMNELVDKLLPKEIIINKDDSQNIWDKKPSISKKDTFLEGTSEEIYIDKLKNRIKEIILQDNNLSEKNILGIDVKEKEYGIHEIIVYMRLIWPFKRIFKSNIWINSENSDWKKNKQNMWLHELSDSKQNYFFRIFLNSIKKEDMKNITIRMPEKGIYKVNYNLYWEIGFKKIFQIQEKNWKTNFKEVTELVELQKAELQRKMIEHWLNVIFIYPTSFAEKVIIDWYKTYLYKCKFKEPENEQILIWKFYVNKDWELKQFFETKK